MPGYRSLNHPQTNTGLLLAHRLRRWPNNKPALAERLVLAEVSTFIRSMQ